MPKSNKIQDVIHMDYAASISPNPSSIHSAGVIAKKKLEEARKQVADILGARTEEIIFTSGGTEGNNLAIQGLVFVIEKNIPHIITTNIEHPSVLETYRLLKKRKLAEISIVPVEKNGIVDPKKIKKEIKNNTVLISVMYANNEIGTIQPIREIAREIRHWKKMKARNFSFPLFHTDAVQAVNYLDVTVEKLGVDLLTISGSKIEGAGRVGVLYKKKSIILAPLFGGGDQEQGIRPGTENLPEILKFAKALREVSASKDKEIKRVTTLRDYFVEKINIVMSIDRNKRTRRLKVNGDMQNRLPNNINITFLNIPSELVVIELSRKGIMASAKSACKSGEIGGSYVINAICEKKDFEIGGVRFSFGKKTTKKEIDYTIKSLSEILRKLKKWYN